MTLEWKAKNVAAATSLSPSPTFTSGRNTKTAGDLSALIVGAVPSELCPQWKSGFGRRCVRLKVTGVGSGLLVGSRVEATGSSTNGGRIVSRMKWRMGRSLTECMSAIAATTRPVLDLTICSLEHQS